MMTKIWDKFKNWANNIDIKFSKWTLNHLLAALSDEDHLRVTYYRFSNSKFLITRLALGVVILIFTIENSIYSFFQRKTNEKARN